MRGAGHKEFQPETPLCNDRAYHVLLDLSPPQCSRRGELRPLTYSPQAVSLRGCLQMLEERGSRHALPHCGSRPRLHTCRHTSTNTLTRHHLMSTQCIGPI